MSDVILKTVQRVTGYPADAVRILPRSPIDIQSNNLYDVWTKDGHWIAKEFLKPAEYEESPQREFDSLKLIEALDIAPRPIHLEAHTESARPVVIYAYMDGEMWDRRKPSAADLAALCGLWERMHGVTRPDLWPSRAHPLREVLSWFAAGAALYSAWAEIHHPAGVQAIRRVTERLPRLDTLVDELDRLPAKMLFCRSDPRFANIIARPDGRIGMVDWEDAGLRDPALECVDLLLHANQEDLLSPVEWAAFTTPYAALHAADRAFSQRMMLYAELMPYFWFFGILRMGVTRLIEGKLDAAPLANGLPINQRLRRYFAHIIAGPTGDFHAALTDTDVITLLP